MLSFLDSISQQVFNHEKFSPNSNQFTKVPLNEPFSCIMMNQPFSCHMSNMINEDAIVTETLKKRLVTCFSSVGCTVDIESSNHNEEKYEAFYLYSNGVQQKRNGNANVKYAWYFGSKDELKTILSNGFGMVYCNGSHGYGCGVYLSPFSPGNLRSAVLDEYGFKNALLCRVILGNTEVVSYGSAQCMPSSEEFDSGIDDLASPKKYIVWIGDVSTRILPEFVFRVKAPSRNRGFPRRRILGNTHFSNLMRDLSKFVPADAIELISKQHDMCLNGKISAHELFQQARCIVGAELLNKVAKSYLEKLRLKQKQVEHESKFEKEMIRQFSSQLNI